MRVFLSILTFSVTCITDSLSQKTTILVLKSFVERLIGLGFNGKI